MNPLKALQKIRDQEKLSYEYKNFTYITDSVKKELMIIQEENSNQIDNNIS